MRAKCTNELHMKYEACPHDTSWRRRAVWFHLGHMARVCTVDCARMHTYIHIYILAVIIAKPSTLIAVQWCARLTCNYTALEANKRMSDWMAARRSRWWLTVSLSHTHTRKHTHSQAVQQYELDCNTHHSSDYKKLWVTKQGVFILSVGVLSDVRTSANSASPSHSTCVDATFDNLKATKRQHGCTQATWGEDLLCLYFRYYKIVKIK